VPSTLDEVQPSYRLGVGEATIDLSHIALPPEGRTLKASIGVGQLKVVVPDSGRVVVAAHAGAGDLEILGRHNDGWDVDQRVVDGDPAAGSLRLDLDVGAGEIDVMRVSSDFPLRLRPPTTELPPAAPIVPTPPVPTSAAA
jgi:predicted membrane protein